MPDTRKRLAEKLGVGIETLRYYEKLGLIPPPERDANGYRKYSADCEKELRHIIQAKTYGFTPKEIKALIEESRHREFTKDDVRSIARLKVRDIERRIAELNASRNLLLDFLRSFGT